MSAAERWELGLIPIAGAAAWLLAPRLPGALELGQLLLVLFALFLLQGLLRDLWLLYLSRWARGRPAHPAPPRAARCMCVESVIGVVGIVAGVVLLAAGLGPMVPLAPWGWVLTVVLITLAGFLLKDYVFEWSPWRLHREKDHANVIFQWRK